MKSINPILALAGAAAKAGSRMFAQDLLELGRGVRDAKATRKTSKRLTGLTLLGVAYVVNADIQRNPWSAK